MREDRLVRNPVLALPGVAEALAALPAEARAALRLFLKALAADCAERADKCWRTHKGPMALYWKVVGVWAGHLRRAVPA